MCQTLALCPSGPASPAVNLLPAPWLSLFQMFHPNGVLQFVTSVPRFPPLHTAGKFIHGVPDVKHDSTQMCGKILLPPTSKWKQPTCLSSEDD